MSSLNIPVRNRCMPLAEWPPADQAAWREAFRPATPFKPDGLAATWAAATSGLVENGYGRWLTWLQSRGVLDPLLPPGDRVTPERAKAYLDDLAATCSDFTLCGRIQQLGNAMRAMAPEKDWRWLLRASSRLRAGARPLRDKRQRLQSLDRLVELGSALMTEADGSVHVSSAMRARLYRDGLIIALLARRPVRRKNLTAITLGEHITGDDAVRWLDFKASEMKGGRAFEAAFPAGLVPPLVRYLEVYRPVLLARGKASQRPPTDALWISGQGTRMSAAAIAAQIRQRTKAAFGVALTPHRFRDCTGTAIAVETPEHVNDIPRVLAHSDLAVSERHYNLAGSIEAGRRYQESLSAVRSRKKT